MNKLEKSKNLEAARVLLISARDLVQLAINKVKETGPSGISSAMAAEGIFRATIIVVNMQDKLESKS